MTTHAHATEQMDIALREHTWRLGRAYTAAKAGQYRMAQIHIEQAQAAYQRAMRHLADAERAALPPTRPTLGAVLADIAMTSALYLVERPCDTEAS